MHESRYLVYDGKYTYKEVFNLANKECMNSGEYHTGLGDLRIINSNGIYNNYDEAYNAIQKSDRGFYDEICCKYYDYPELIKSKKFLDLEKRIQDWRKKYNDLKNKVHYKGVKSSFIFCPSCQSKINKEFIRTNNCPVCYAEMRPKTVLDTINRYLEIMLGLQNELSLEKNKLELKQRKNAKVKWLVKIEYHV